MSAFTLSFVPGGSSLLKKKNHSENISLSNPLEWPFTVKWYNRKMNYKLYCFWHIRLHLLALDELQRSMITITHAPKRRYGEFPHATRKGQGSLYSTLYRQMTCTKKLTPSSLHTFPPVMQSCNGPLLEATVETAPRSPTHSTLTFSYRQLER